MNAQNVKNQNSLIIVNLTKTVKDFSEKRLVKDFAHKRYGYYWTSYINDTGILKIFLLKIKKKLPAFCYCLKTLVSRSCISRAKCTVPTRIRIVLDSVCYPLRLCKSARTCNRSPRNTAERQRSAN